MTLLIAISCLIVTIIPLGLVVYTSFTPRNSDQRRIAIALWIISLAVNVGICYWALLSPVSWRYGGVDWKLFVGTSAGIMAFVSIFVVGLEARLSAKKH